MGYHKDSRNGYGKAYKNANASMKRMERTNRNMERNVNRMARNADRQVKNSQRMSGGFNRYSNRDEQIVHQHNHYHYNNEQNDVNYNEGYYLEQLPVGITIL